MTTRNLRFRLLSAAVVTVAAMALTGSAYAFWSIQGSGSGSFTTGSTTALNLSPTGTGGTLFPGGKANVVLTVANPNAASIHIGSFTLDTTQGTGGFAFDASHSGCATTSLTFTSQTNGGAGWTVPKKVGTVNGSLSIVLANALGLVTNAANACQGAITTIYLVAGP